DGEHQTLHKHLLVSLTLSVLPDNACKVETTSFLISVGTAPPMTSMEELLNISTVVGSWNSLNLIHLSEAQNNYWSQTRLLTLFMVNSADIICHNTQQMRPRRGGGNLMVAKFCWGPSVSGYNETLCTGIHAKTSTINKATWELSTTLESARSSPRCWG
ncbi:hypothetical protein C0J52_22762, partial [Blattella germanica]